MNTIRFSLILGTWLLLSQLVISPSESIATEKKLEYFVHANILPPIKPWHGRSERLIQPSTNPWQTDAEKTQLTDTPNYADTFLYVDKLVNSDHRLHKISLGKSPQGRDIWMIIASKEGAKDAATFKQLNKPTLLIQAGIHAGEIDGKDAGLMLLRDIIHGNKGSLIDEVNLLFVPILSVDAHERRSPFNRVNQRGPLNMGWRTNASNLNLNRDYTKLDTQELRYMIKAINQWQPDLYYDVHVTDGEDYQYDVTYGFNLSYGESPTIGRWMEQNLKPYVNQSLKENGHQGGPLTFGADSMDFSKGIIGWAASPRFSNGYGDFRQLPTVLVENHSLKSYKQRVLGTYILLESTLELLANKGYELQQATISDSNRRPKEVVVAWEIDDQNLESMDYAGIAFIQQKDEQTGLDFIQWTGEAKQYKNLPIFAMKKAKQTVSVPKSYWIPPQYKEIINRLKWHGIKTKIHTQPIKLKASQLKVTDYELKADAFEGRQMVSANFESLIHQYELPVNSVEVSTDQPFGRLVVALLDPRAPDSFFSWGFFNQIFQRTEYIETYAIIPLTKLLFEENPKLKQKYEQLKTTNAVFSQDQKAQLQWLYSQSSFYDQEYLKYPILMSY